MFVVARRGTSDTLLRRQGLSGAKSRKIWLLQQRLKEHMFCVLFAQTKL